MVEETPDEFDVDAELRKLTLNDDFISEGVREAPADERIAKAQRIARANNSLRNQGEISDGTGKPLYRKRKRNFLIAIAALTAVGIVVVAVLTTA